MKNLIKNIVANSKDSKILRKDIFNYFESNEAVSKKEIKVAISELVEEGLIKINEVDGEFYDVHEYELTEKGSKEFMI